MKKSFLALFLAFTLLISTIPVSFAFSDTEGHWAQQYIDRAVENQLFNGVTEDRFAPDETMTRGMFITVLGRFEGIDTEFWSREGAPQFFKQDVDNDSYYAAHIRWGVCNGIVNGINDFLYAPDRAITREQMAKLISYYLDSMGHSLISENPELRTGGSEATDDDNSQSDETIPNSQPDTEPAPSEGVDPIPDDNVIPDTVPDSDPVTDPKDFSFADEDKISSWALESVMRLYHAGILTGFAEDDGTVTFRPEASLTRAQCATVLCRVMDALIRSESEPVFAEEISLNKDEVSLSEGYSFRLFVQTKPDAIDVLWRSSDTSVVTVDQQGLVTFVAPGYADVSVYTRDGLYDTCHFICEGIPEEDIPEEDEEETPTEPDNNTNPDDSTDDDTTTDNPDTDDSDSGNTEPEPNPNLPNANFTKEEKSVYMFGESVKDPRLYYSTSAEAKADMVQVQVQAWYLQSNGEKVPRTWTLTVHKSLADTVKAIFDEIFKGPEQFPIHDMYCYSWSGKSEHSIGAAIDINYNENYYCDPDGNAITGSFWKPGENPYSITPDGDVVKAFNKYGYIWCINWNSGYKDYMHFSFFGT